MLGERGHPVRLRAQRAQYAPLTKLERLAGPLPGFRGSLVRQNRLMVRGLSALRALADRMSALRHPNREPWAVGRRKVFTLVWRWLPTRCSLNPSRFE